MTRADLEAGRACFNAGDYFDAHEAWEDHWGSGDENERNATLALIKTAVGFLHFKNGNRSGALAQLGWAVGLFRSHGHAFPELDLAAFAESVDGVRAAIRFHEDDFDELRRTLPLPKL